MPTTLERPRAEDAKDAKGERERLKTCPVRAFSVSRRKSGGVTEPSRPCYLLSVPAGAGINKAEPPPGTAPLLTAFRRQTALLLSA